MSKFLHTKSRLEYQGGIKRFLVQDNKVDWNIQFPEYNPVDYTAPVVKSKPIWADIDLFTEKDLSIKWNSIDGKVDRRSFDGKYEIIDNVPRNIFGRTGMKGRGLLGRWGPNHAADPVVTRWKRDNKNTVVIKNGKKVLEFVAIKRKDGGAWAIPGGMVDPGENVSVTLKREFGEEAMNTIEQSEEERNKIEKQINELFKHGLEVYKGYVDDPRNTDNAWMETVAVNFHDDDGNIFNKFKLQAGDDAGAVRWMELDSSIDLYASHIQFLKNVAQQRGSHF